MWDEMSCDTVMLDELRRGSRTVAYGTAGDPLGAPVLFFYPLGGNRRMLSFLHQHALDASVRLICVNRPGKYPTSDAEDSESEHLIGTVCDDTVAVLNFLAVSRASLLFMCAGTPFALAFASCVPSRCADTIMGIASWILPGDSDESKLMYRLGAAMPSCLISPVVGKTLATMNGSLGSFPVSWILSGVRSSLTEAEQILFDRQFADAASFVSRMQWIHQECGGECREISVLLSDSKHIGIEFASIRSKVLLFHGQQDTTVPFPGAEWLQTQLLSATLESIETGSHEGSIFFLHPMLLDGLKLLAS